MSGRLAKSPKQNTSKENMSSFFSDFKWTARYNHDNRVFPNYTKLATLAVKA